jgi:hypothetical protein
MGEESELQGERVCVCVYVCVYMCIYVCVWEKGQSYKVCT